MIKIISITVVILGSATAVLGQQLEEQLRYVERFKTLAVWEMERRGVPASIKLSQALLESRWGTTDLAVIANNHFGIKCGGNVWQGPFYNKFDDEFDAQGRPIESCFRYYSSAEESYIAHSEFLRDPIKKDRYGFLFDLNPLDYKAWAIGLKKAGYATDPNYHLKLIRIIEQLNLMQYDRVKLEEVLPASRELVWKYRRGEASLPPLAVPVWSDIRPAIDPAASSEGAPPVAALMSYKEDRDHPARLLSGRNTRRHAHHEKTVYKGEAVWHTVRPNELLANISLQYGVNLLALYRRNLLPEGSEVAAGQRVKLRGGKVDQQPMLRPPLAAPIVQHMPEEEAPPVSPNISRPDPFFQPTKGKAENRTNAPARGVTAPLGAKPSTSSVQAGGVDPLPLPAVTGQEASSPRVETPEPGRQYHVVRPGETLFSIAKQYGMSIDELKALNVLNGQTIVSGTALRIR